MKSVLISIQPKWCEFIANGKKTVEVRKTKPKLDTPFKVYIYCTRNKRQWLRKVNNFIREIFITENRDVLGRTDKVKSVIGGMTTFVENGGYNGKVIGEFVCNEITYLGNVSTDPWYSLLGNVHESHKQLVTKYACLTEEELLKYGGKYAWHISNLVIYDKPRELSEFYVPVKDHWETYNPSNYINGCWQKPLQRPPQSWCYVESGAQGNE